MTAYLVFAIDTKTGRVCHAGIYSEPNPTHTMPWMLVRPAESEYWSCRADSYTAAKDLLREQISRHIMWFGKDGTPIRDALARLASGVGDGTVRLETP